MRGIWLWALVALVLVIGFLALLSYGSPLLSPLVEDDGRVVCTADAKLCPDGSYVGRTGPDCEFAACPEAATSTAGRSGIEGLVLSGPHCPVVQEGEKCPDRPFAARLALTAADQSRVIREFQSDAQGRFSIDVPPGTYAIRSAAAANVLPYCSSGPITVVAGRFASTTVSCDTGIR